MDRSGAPWRALEVSGSGGSPDALAPEPGRTSGFGGPWLAFAALAVSGVFAVGAFAVAASGTGSVTVDGGTLLAGSDEPTGDASASSGAQLVVELAGAVVEPGVYRLPAGTRVGEAIERAGGYGPRVDAERATRELNLAGVLADGDRVLVPSRDDPPEHVIAPASQGAGGTAGLIDLNSATQTELESLPGIGPVTAGKIIAAREEQPFTNVDELRGRGLVGEKTFASLSALVTVR
jgi:competence protein ComEA